MTALKTASPLLVAAASLLLSACAAERLSAQPAALLPTVHPVDRRFLTQLARRTMEAAIDGRDEYTPGHVPPALNSVDCQIVVTLRKAGYPMGIGVSQVAPLVDACQEAAAMALVSAGIKGHSESGLLDEVRIEMQLVGSSTPYSGAADWFSPDALDDFVDPGLDGVRLMFGDQQRWFTPAEIVAKNLPVDEAVRTLAKDLGLAPGTLPEARVARFQTLHWWEIDDAGNIVSLRRGLIPIPLDAVTASGLDDSIDRLARYLQYRQTPDGRFNYEYLPAGDVYSDADSEVAQSGAAWALACYARRTGAEPARNHADQAIRARLSQLVELPDAHGAAFIAEPDARNKLGSSAQLCLALVDGPDPRQFAAERKRLLKGLLWVQLESGRFVTAFPPSQVLDTQDRYPGQALLALARCYELEPSAEILDSFATAYAFYRDYFAKTGSPAMVPWHTQAFAAMARMTKKRDYAEFVYRMADQVCAHQLGPENCESPELWGAVAAGGALPPGASTANLLAGLADAASLAAWAGDDERQKHYAEACKSAARFVMQLQVRREECFYVRSLKDTVDGIRNSPIDSRLRIDNCQHALIGLIKARKLLFLEPS